MVNRGRLGRVLVIAIAEASAVGCAQIVGNESGNPNGPCASDQDCANGQTCSANGECVDMASGGDATTSPPEAALGEPRDAAAGSDGDSTVPSEGATEGSAVEGGADVVGDMSDADAGPEMNSDASDADADVVDEDAPDADVEGDADADADANAEEEPPPVTPCEAGATICDPTGQYLETCGADGGWQSEACQFVCQTGACVLPPSCGTGDVSTCGPDQTESCCRARAVPGGTFYRSYDGVTSTDMSYPATVSTFTLDVYEVTVTRFTNFVMAYDSWYKSGKPSPGDGKNPSDITDTGWSAEWNEEDLQPNASALASEVVNCEGTWTPNIGQAPNIGQNDNLPMTCLDWYTAFAFCIWDGGRLPTEAEWNYAAAGGADQRVYPWSVPLSDPDSGTPVISSEYAIYNVTAPARAGSLVKGDGKWGHRDLAGNAEEWVRDSYVSPYASTSCDNCANFTAGIFPVIRGGNFYYDQTRVTASRRENAPGDAADVTSTIGVRCARPAP